MVLDIELISKLYEQRRDELIKSGLIISNIEELYDMYEPKRSKVTN